MPSTMSASPSSDPEMEVEEYETHSTPESPYDNDAASLTPEKKTIDFWTYTPKYDFSFGDFLKREYRFGLDDDRPLCKAFLQGHCPLGASCSDKHHVQPGLNSLVCKHWMRGLCKKGEHCEYLHEYNMRRMPECNNFARLGYCQNGDDCMWQHLDPALKKPSCPHYERGFCPLGPLCAKKHVKHDTICLFYLAGFCPRGKECPDPHPRFPTDLKKPVVVGQEDPEEERELERQEREKEIMEQRAEEDRTYNSARDDGGAGDGSGFKQGFSGGRGNWKGKKRGGFRKRGM